MPRQPTRPSPSSRRCADRLELYAPALLQSNLRKQATAASAHREKSLTKTMAEGVDLGHDDTACPPGGMPTDSK
jgi:hypothetical protein